MAEKFNEASSESFDKKSAITAAYAAIKTTGYEKKGSESYYVKGGHGMQGTKGVEYDNTTSKVMKDVLKAQNGSLKGEPSSYAKDAIKYIDDNFDECTEFYESFEKYVDGLDDERDFNRSVKTAFLNGSADLESAKFGVIAAAVNGCIKDAAFKKINDENEKTLNKKDFKPEDSEFLGSKGDKVTVKVSSLLKKDTKTKTGNNIIEGYDETGNKFVIFVRDNDLPADLNSVKVINGEIYGLSSPDGKWNDRKSTSLINVSFDKDVSGLPDTGDNITVEVADIKMNGPFDNGFGDYFEVIFTDPNGIKYYMNTGDNEKIQDMIDGIIPCKEFTCKVKYVQGDKVHLVPATFRAEGKTLRSLVSSAAKKRGEEMRARKEQEEAEKAAREQSKKETELKYGVKIDSYRPRELTEFDTYTASNDYNESREAKKLDDGTTLIYHWNYARMSDYDAYGEGINVYDNETGWNILKIEYDDNNYRIKGMGKSKKDAFDAINSFEDAQEWNAEVRALEDKVRKEENAEHVDDAVAERIIHRSSTRYVNSEKDLPEGCLNVGGYVYHAPYDDEYYSLYAKPTPSGTSKDFYYTKSVYHVGD